MLSTLSTHHKLIKHERKVFLPSLREILQMPLDFSDNLSTMDLIISGMAESTEEKRSRTFIFSFNNSTIILAIIEQQQRPAYGCGCGCGLGFGCCHYHPFAFLIKETKPLSEAAASNDLRLPFPARTSKEESKRLSNCGSYHAGNS
ncbi:uncharacterized protein DS421_15g514000 [Arachis hypogaea]|nr:uncharacterized protein DS421_15g514000 [Arachis hypogaea]